MSNTTNETSPLSLCIPRLTGEIKETFIRHVFNKLNLGQIGRIDLIVKRNEKNEIYKTAFIHYNNWNINDNTIYIKNRLQNNQDIKIVYDDPWYWKVSLNKFSKKH